MRNKSVNNYGVVQCECEGALTAVCTTPPVKDRILAISVRDDASMGFTRAEQTLPLGESKTPIQAMW